MQEELDLPEYAKITNEEMLEITKNYSSERVLHAIELCAKFIISLSDEKKPRTMLDLVNYTTVLIGHCGSVKAKDIDKLKPFETCRTLKIADDNGIIKNFLRKLVYLKLVARTYPKKNSVEMFKRGKYTDVVEVFAKYDQNAYVSKAYFAFVNALFEDKHFLKKLYAAFAENK